MFTVWVGLLALSGEMATAAWTRLANFDCDTTPIAPNLDSESPYTDHACTYLQTCYPCTVLAYSYDHPQQRYRLLRRAASYEHSGCGDGRSL